MAPKTPIAVAQSKSARQTSEIARLTQALERVTAESIRRRKALLEIAGLPDWRVDDAPEIARRGLDNGGV